MRQFHALLAIASNAPDWRTRLDTTEDGIFGSFIALPVSVAFIIVEFLCARELLLASAHPDIIEKLTAQPIGTGALINGLSGGTSWLLALAAVALIAKRASKTEGFGYFLPAFNWASLLLYGGRAMAVIALFALSQNGFSPTPDLVLTLMIFTFGFSVYLFWSIFHRALGLSALQALGAFILVCLIEIFTQLSLAAVIVSILP